MRGPSSPGTGVCPAVRGLLRRAGFSLIELLVVIAIIAILISLIFNAAQVVRESALRVYCANSLRQMGMGANAHAMLYGRYPTGGWGWGWIGDPDRGNDKTQPGGWVYNLLPFLELNNMHDKGKGLPSPAKQAAIVERLTATYPQFNCPTRRTGGPWPNPYNYQFGETNPLSISVEARTDYAANVGDGNQNEFFWGPGNLAQGDDPSFGWHDTSGCTGVIFERSEIRPMDVTRGVNNVYLFGEKYLNPDHYYVGNDAADNECMFTGMNNDICRVTSSLPIQDKRGYSDTVRFGSAHRFGSNYAFCDGSVRFVLYTINADVHRQSGNRKAN